MSAERVIANTLRLAKADLEAANLLQVGKNRYAIYHCEQAAEKVIKAVLTSEGIHANIKHMLDDMVKQVPDANPLKPLLKAIEHLAAYATTYRYATTSGNIKPARGVREVLRGGAVRVKGNPSFTRGVPVQPIVALSSASGTLPKWLPPEYWTDCSSS